VTHRDFSFSRRAAKTGHVTKKQRTETAKTATGADRGVHPFGLGIVSRKTWEFHGISWNFLLYRAVPVCNYILNNSTILML
jgi:hypothetical protein